MKMKNNFKAVFYSCLTIIILTASCSRSTTSIKSGLLKLEINPMMQTRVSSLETGAKELMTDFQNSEFLITRDGATQNFKLTDVRKSNDKQENSVSWTFSGTSVGSPETITKNVNISVYGDFPDWAFYKVQYVNSGTKDVIVKKWVNNALAISTQHDSPDFWSFQGSSSASRKDWILPVSSGFNQRNFLGMTSSDYGGGIPVVDIWRKDAGIAIGHTEMVPKIVSLPVEMANGSSSSKIAVEYEYPSDYVLHPGDTLNTFGTFISVHRGDYFHTLRQYSLYMQKKGIKMPESEPAAFEPIWCAWGYERKFTVDEVLGTLQKVKEIGFKWVGIDDGFQQNEGDWDVNKTTFPGGDAQMKGLVDKIHSYGMKAQLWWAPMAVDPQSNLYRQQPDLIIKDKGGNPENITWWDSYYMSPVYKGTLDHTREMVMKFMKEWNYDGLKLDGQHLNACLPDYNPQHNLKNPEEAPEGMPNFFKLIYQTAREIKPNAIVELCPCGDAMSFYNIPWTNQFVASDPESSFQVRSKGKTYKAIAPQTAYFGDHAERSDLQSNLSSTIGVGGVPGSKFTWPKDNPFVTEGHFVLTEEMEALWKKWMSLYNREMISNAEYMGDLYDIGYDKPETHAIQKGDTLYYAFYADSWNNILKLKGLTQKKYKIVDYYNNKDYGFITTENPEVQVSFNGFLLLKATPVKE